ncbi:MAG TPA: hypothetical protein VHD61_15700 [Lacunisphaera sp.]|nr:hypothetical protein [Lacunisphaera sp.]
MNKLPALIRSNARRFQRSHSLFALFVCTAFIAVAVVAAATACAANNSLAAPKHIGALPVIMGLTLTTPQLLLDVMGAFVKRFPAARYFGGEWRGAPLKLNQSYTAHIASYGSASTYDANSGGYKNGANSARNGLADVQVVVNQQPTYPLKWAHLDFIKDIKNQYDKVIAGAGYVLGKAFIDGGFFAKMTTRYFSQEIVSAAADCDYEWLQSLTKAANAKGMEPEGRVLFVNSDVASVLAVDPRMISKDFAGQLLNGQGYRMWQNIGGFALIQEYPDLPSNNATALTAVSATAATDVLAKTAHGLVTGDPIVISAIGGGAAGLATGTRYWVIKVDADSFKLATSYANAIAGTAINVTSDSSGGGLTLALTENLIAFVADGRAFGFLAGVPDGISPDLIQQLGITPTMTFDTPVREPNSGVIMTAAKWQEAGTGDLFWVPTFVHGTNAGKQGATAVATNSEAANSALAAANAAGTACDYAGLRVTSGA